VSFFKTAWHSAAQEYGSKRAEKYGRLAHLGAAVGYLLMVVLGIGIFAAGNGWFGG
jgi:hypothetical protein